ncbi:MAG: NAD(P)H-dependent oxidoreductase [Pseudomonadales bacterium]|nr:NAD(P)H-dependent oxidoreductase [Pseudomonadales bacterium]
MTQTARQVLQLNSSILGDNSVSNQLLATLTERLQAAGEKLEIQQRDFSVEPVPHFDEHWLQALMTPEADRSDSQQQKVDFSDTLIAELKAADILIIGLPMYNFSVPSMLKAWNDHVARAGATFKYTDTGPVGLLENKKVFLVAAMGGVHKVGESDYLRPYMQQFLGLLGLTDISFVTASGLNMGEEPRAEGISRAEAEIDAAVQAYRQKYSKQNQDYKEEEAA